MKVLKGKVSRLLSRTPLQYFPVTVRGGLAKGARWTLLPYSANWRGYAEQDVEQAIQLYGQSLKGATCWDLGTHFGIFTVGMAMAVGREGQVVGVEPDPVSFNRCRRHVRMNGLHWVKLINAAASDQESRTTLIASEGKGATTSHLAYETETLGANSTLIEIKTISLDQQVESGAIRPPQFIKIDVEGHGAKALRGARRTVSRHLPTIVMSFHSAWEVDETRELLEPLGYECLNCEGRTVAWPDSSFRTTLIMRPRG